MAEKLIILGAGEMSQRLADLAEATGRFDRDSITFLSMVKEEEVDGIPVIHEALSSAKKVAEDTPGSRPVFINGLGHVEAGYADIPNWLISTGLGPHAFTSLVHPTVLDSMSKRAKISPYGAAVFPNTTLEGGVFIGPHSIVLGNGNWGLGASIGAYGTARANVTVESGARAGNSVYLGAGSTVERGRKIGDGALVRSGVTVSTNIFPGYEVVQSPARQIQQRLRE